MAESLQEAWDSDQRYKKNIALMEGVENSPYTKFGWTSKEKNITGDDEHTHQFAVDEFGYGITTDAGNKSSHNHFIHNYKIGFANGHVHTIASYIDNNAKKTNASGLAGDEMVRKDLEDEYRSIFKGQKAVSTLEKEAEENNVKQWSSMDNKEDELDKSYAEKVAKIMQSVKGEKNALLDESASVGIGLNKVPANTIPSNTIASGPLPDGSGMISTVISSDPPIQVEKLPKSEVYKVLADEIKSYLAELLMIEYQKERKAPNLDNFIDTIITPQMERQDAWTFMNDLDCAVPVQLYNKLIGKLYSLGIVVDQQFSEKVKEYEKVVFDKFMSPNIMYNSGKYIMNVPDITWAADILAKDDAKGYAAVIEAYAPELESYIENLKKIIDTLVEYAL